MFSVFRPNDQRWAEFVYAAGSAVFSNAEHVRPVRIPDGAVTVCGTNEGGFLAAVSVCPDTAARRGDFGRRGPAERFCGGGALWFGPGAVWGLSGGGLPLFGRLSEGLRYPAAANRGKLIIFIAVSVSAGMYPAVRPGGTI